MIRELLVVVIHWPCGLVAESGLCGPPLTEEVISGFLIYLMTIPIESIRLNLYPFCVQSEYKDFYLPNIL